MDTLIHYAICAWFTLIAFGPYVAVMFIGFMIYDQS
jgi:hypothetical protein